MLHANCYAQSWNFTHMWQSRIEIEHYSVAYFDCNTWCVTSSISLYKTHLDDLIVSPHSKQPFSNSEDCEQFCYRYEDHFRGFSRTVITVIDQFTQTPHYSNVWPQFLHAIYGVWCQAYPQNTDAICTFWWHIDGGEVLVAASLQPVPFKQWDQVAFCLALCQSSRLIFQVGWAWLSGVHWFPWCSLPPCTLVF